MISKQLLSPRRSTYRWEPWPLDGRPPVTLPIIVDIALNLCVFVFWKHQTHLWTHELHGADQTKSEFE